jgi:hypothetical protein
MTLSHSVLYALPTSVRKNLTVQDARAMTGITRRVSVQDGQEVVDGRDKRGRDGNCNWVKGRQP